MKNKILIIDGYSFLFRAYYAMQKLTRSDGTPTGAVYGFINMVLNIRKFLHCTHLLLTFDTGKKSFRNEIYKEYKAHRPPAPEDLIPQFPMVREAARSMGIKIIEKEGYEADDIIATVAKKAEAKDFDVVILSSDKDLMQLVNDNIVLYDGMKRKEIGVKEVKEKFDVKPEQILDLLSLMGDASDNIPGVPSIGPKTAAELINKYGSLEEVYQHIDEIKRGKRRAVLQENKDKAFLSKKLVALKDNVPLDAKLSDMILTEIAKNDFLNFLEKQEFTSIIHRFHLANGNIDNGNSSVKKNGKNYGFQKNIEKLEELDDLINSANSYGKLFFNFEESSIALSGEKHKIYCIPLKENAEIIEGDLFSESKEKSENKNLFAIKDILKYLKKLFEDDSIIKIGYNIKEEIKVLKEYGIELNAYDDIQVISYCLDAGKIKHTFSNIIASNLLGKVRDGDWYLDFKHKKLSISEKQNIIENKEKGNLAKEYEENLFEILCFKIETISAVYQILKNRLHHENVAFIYSRFDHPLIKVLADMEMNGVAIDVVKLKNLSSDFDKIIKKTEKEIYKLSNSEFNIASPKQLSEVLFEKMKLPKGKKLKKSGDYSTNSKVLENLAIEGYKIADKILEWRHFTKLKSTYTDALPKQINPKTNRIHTTFSSVVASTGRLSSNNPNLQNIPIKSEEGTKIRSAFSSRRGYKLVGADYSQIELRILADYANVKKLKEAFKDEKDIHTNTASQVFGVDEKDVTSEMRRRAKGINFGIVYGISGFGLARQIRVTNEEANKYIKAYFEKYPEIKKYMEKMKKFAKENGFVETMFGRKCFINMNARGAERGFMERLAINAPMQGTAADIIKKAMIDLYVELKKGKLDAKVVLQVHDELIIEVKNEDVVETEKLLEKVMEKAAKNALSIPLKVDVHSGNSWDEIH
ncbi:DNA polymerase I [Pseudomonadota bacterium]